MEIPAAFINEHEKTFQCQDSLPSSPIPTLQHTLSRYLDSVRPHVTDEEFKKTQSIVNQFASGVGKTLQEKLADKHKHSRNWLEEYWLDKAYLEGRYPTAPLINITGPGPYMQSLWPPKEGTQIERGALVIWTHLQYWDLIRKEKLKVDRGGKKTVWCMDQYRRVFNTCKIPGIHKDQLLNYFKTEKENDCPTHLCVICNGRFFTFDVLHENGDILTAPELEEQLEKIKNICDNSPPIPGLGAVTSENRTTWAKIREHIISISSENEKHLEEIQSSLFVLVLEDLSPKTFNEVALQGLAGNCEQRWFDKCVNVAVFRNGTIASNLDHSPSEGIIYILATHFCQLILDKCEGKWKGTMVKNPLPSPRELQFQLDGRVYEAIKTAKINYHKLADDLDVYCGVYKGYGKDFLKIHKLHPDTFSQLALQLAYYRLHKKPAPTYETGSARKFFHGRTETVRSCTVEAIDWCKTMLDSSVPNTRRFQLLLNAVNKHNKLMTEAQELHGCDRHMLGLSVIAQEGGLETPHLFTDPSFTKSGGDGNFVLSTSFLAYTSVIGGCAPMCTNGYGIFYSIQEQTITYFLTGWKSGEDTCVRKLYSSMEDSLHDMKKVVESGALQHKI